MNDCSKFLKQCLCTSYLVSNPDKIADIDVIKELEAECSEELFKWSIGVAMPIVMGVVVSLLNFILNYVVNSMSSFMRPSA